MMHKRPRNSAVASKIESSEEFASPHTEGRAESAPYREEPSFGSAIRNRGVDDLTTVLQYKLAHQDFRFPIISRTSVENSVLDLFRYAFPKDFDLIDKYTGILLVEFWSLTEGRWNSKFDIKYAMIVCIDILHTIHQHYIDNKFAPPKSASNKPTHNDMDSIFEEFNSHVAALRALLVKAPALAQHLKDGRYAEIVSPPSKGETDSRNTSAIFDEVRKELNALPISSESIFSSKPKWSDKDARRGRNPARFLREEYDSEIKSRLINRSILAHIDYPLLQAYVGWTRAGRHIEDADILPPDIKTHLSKEERAARRRAQVAASVARYRARRLAEA